jgi:hypothetical protein
MVFRMLLPLLVCATLAFPQSGSPPPSKETFTFTIEWRLFTAGKAKLELTSMAQPRAGYQASMHLESAGIVSRLFRVVDDYSANMNAGYCGPA